MRTDYEIFDEKFHQVLNREITALRTKHFLNKIKQVIEKISFLPQVMQNAIVRKYVSILEKPAMLPCSEDDLWLMEYIPEPLNEHDCISLAMAYKIVMQANEDFHIAMSSDDEVIADAFANFKVLLKLR